MLHYQCLNRKECVPNGSNTETRNNVRADKLLGSTRHYGKNIIIIIIVLLYVHVALTLLENDTIGRFTAVCSVPWLLNGSKAGSDLVLLQTFLFFVICNDHVHGLVSMRTLRFEREK